MKFIHCSDIHLGASMRTHLTLEQAKKRQEELLATFSRMVDYAKNNDISGILIAGDLLDTDECDLKTRNFLIHTIENANEINFYYLCGNHDENSLLLHGDALPSNLFVFGNDWTSFQIGNITITGATLGTNNEKLYSSLSLSPQNFNIVVLHGGEVRGTTCNVPDTVNLDLLKNKNIDYLALGHLHTFKTGRLDTRAEYCYSGCLEGRGFDECGEKGFVLIEIINHNLSTTFVPFARRSLYEITVDISELTTTREIINKIEQQLENISHESLIRIVLTGSYSLNTEKHLSLILANLENKYFYVQIKDKTHIKLDLQRFIDDVSIAGEFVRSVQNSELDEALKKRIIMLGLRVLNGEEVDL